MDSGRGRTLSSTATARPQMSRVQPGRDVSCAEGQWQEGDPPSPHAEREATGGLPAGPSGAAAALESRPTGWERCSEKAGVTVGRLATGRNQQRGVIPPARQAGLDKTARGARRGRERSKKAWCWGAGVGEAVVWMRTVVPWQVRTPWQEAGGEGPAAQAGCRPPWVLDASEGWPCTGRPEGLRSAGSGKSRLGRSTRQAA